MAVIAALVLVAAGVTSSVAHAATTHRTNLTHRTHRTHRAKRLLALKWAYRQRGKPYQWGGTGPRGFDCSGLVYEAYRHQGINIGRDTAQMLASRKLYRVGRPQLGDLAFYGTGHVELVAGRHLTFGALDAGTRIGWHRWSQWWHPTMYFRVRGAFR